MRGADLSAGIRPITDREFRRFRRFIYERAGIELAEHKKRLVEGRLHRRLRHYGLTTFDGYFALLSRDDQGREQQVAVDLLTTNETYFFREPAHFEYLRRQVLPAFRGRSFRAWSAACSSGEEVYTLAMVLAESLGTGDWRILGSDISERMLRTARTGLYPLQRTREIPRELLARYCLKGVRSQTGNLLMEQRLKERVEFRSINLKTLVAEPEVHDVVFLRNVLIYFDRATKQGVVQRILRSLKPGGLLFLSHVESLFGITDQVQTLGPSIYRKPGAVRAVAS
jgi:chemotaxis protein methyltransferase CheR